MADPKAITHALWAVEASAAHLERIAQSQDDEFRRLLCEIAQNLRLLATAIPRPNGIGIQGESVAA